ncbi:hypothetical protein [Oligoflexus tunisiensis]|uniref:hypothetical protein n=1 Tax=Oligoflexus tunisiensis TaxID=708132 RepID=UPI00114D31FC|nr:hypothetical protein [Oligoflexus tunisiensis]
MWTKTVTRTVLGLALLTSGSIYAICPTSEGNKRLPPWYDGECNISPLFKNPNNACQAKDLLEKFGYDPSTPNMMGVPNIVVDGFSHRPLEYQAWRLCESTQRARCLQSMDLLYISYNNLVSIHFSEDKPDSVSYLEPNPNKKPLDYSFDRAIRFLNTKNDEVLSLIESTSGKAKQRTDSFTAQQSASDLDRAIVNAFKDLSNKASGLSADERVLFESTDSFIRKLTEMNYRVGSLTKGYDCTSQPVPDFNSDFTASVDKYNANIKDASNAIQIIRKELHQRAKHRSDLLALAYYKLKYAFYKKVAGIRGEKIDAIIDQLYRDLALDKLMWEMTDWWTAASINGLARRLHTDYYFYSEPLRILKSQKEQALKFKDRMSSLSGVNSAALAIALKSVDDKVSIIDSDIKYIEKNGWQGFLSLQKNYAARLAAALPNNNICQTKAKEFLAKAGEVKTLAAFDLVSPLYKSTAEVCVGQ